MKRIVKNKIKFSHSNFGFWANLYEHLPEECSGVLVKVYDGDNVINKLNLLSHQLYIKTIKELTEDFKYNLTITPMFEEFSIFDEEE